jgi:hypothetical protein
MDNQKATWEIVNYIKSKYPDAFAPTKIPTSPKNNFDFENLFIK